MGKAIFNPGNPVLVAALLGFDVTDQIEEYLRATPVEWISPKCTPEDYWNAARVAFARNGSKIAFYKALPKASPYDVAAFESAERKPDGPSAGGQFSYDGKCAKLPFKASLAANALWYAPGWTLTEYAFQKAGMSVDARSVKTMIRNAFKEAGIALRIKFDDGNVLFY